MKIYKSLTIGEFHTNHCEDFLIEEPITTSQKIIAVMDGCTMGNESVFASILFGKILRNIAKKLFYEDFMQPSSDSLELQLKTILRNLINEVKKTKNLLGLETNELLSTLIIGILDTDSFKAEILTIGDGLICVDGKLTEYEQDDKPDYLAYHLSENFEEWYSNQNQRLSINKFDDLSISTDGIFTFKNLLNKSYQKSHEEIIDYLLIDQSGSNNHTFLDQKIQMLKDQWNHVVTDDLAIIRIRKSS
ncbi:protein phosphatase 2C domain-containing protein [Aureibacter tunicatorum]|uniref:PPM-type phosphatase domain-containing protein n=1 Tax=Aureibacter tunicatorum TaxID=866807 RepID=A0AAE4BSR8_9BACT|nr:protein phosphatase 2C domain-containing protein [Aureibacter tunicatorum]MDR6239155.1 hypothetical protein [Aureibacter tunicatorum]BDD04919.1 hypothetical protein AUTU_24020 [Aureibacter tunicatorum]